LACSLAQFTRATLKMISGKSKLRSNGMLGLSGVTRIAASRSGWSGCQFHQNDNATVYDCGGVKYVIADSVEYAAKNKSLDFSQIPKLFDKK
jgi:hypothetical protein